MYCWTTFQLPRILRSCKVQVSYVNISEDTREMPQSQNTAFPRHQKKEGWGSNNDKTNVIYETTDSRKKKNCNRGTTLEWSAEKLLIMRTCLYNFDPLKPHVYIVKLGFTGVYIIFLISAQKHRLWYSFEPPRRGGSYEYPQSMFWAEMYKISEFFVWKFSVYGGNVFRIFEQECFRNVVALTSFTRPIICEHTQKMPQSQRKALTRH